MSKMRRVLLTVLLLALVRRPLDILLAAMLPDVNVDPVPQCIAGAVLSVLLMGVSAWLLRPWTSDRLVQKKQVLPRIVLSGAGAVLTRAALSPVDGMWQQWLGLEAASLPVPESIPVAMLYIGTLAIIPAVAEEVYFRGALLTSLLDESRRTTAVLLTGMTFALMHGSAANLPSLLALSALLAMLMLESGHIAVPVAAHLVYNLTALNWPSIPLWGSWLCGAGLIVLCGWLCFRQPKYAQKPMAWPDGLIAAASVLVLAASYIV